MSRTHVQASCSQPADQTVAQTYPINNYLVRCRCRRRRRRRRRRRSAYLNGQEHLAEASNYSPVRFAVAVRFGSSVRSSMGFIAGVDDSVVSSAHAHDNEPK